MPSQLAVGGAHCTAVAQRPTRHRSPTQSAGALHIFPSAHFAHVPPQSTSLSSASFWPLPHCADGAQRRFVHVIQRPSAPCEQPLPSAPAEPEPPQSRSVPVPFFVASE